MFNISFITNGALNDSNTRVCRETKGDQPPAPISREPETHKSRASNGEIVLGQFKETFESPLCFWNESEYEDQWSSAIGRLLAGANKTSLITAMYDPATANFLTWWPLYREGEIVLIQNQLLILDQLTQPFSITMIDDIVRARRTVNDDGMKISEWSVPLVDVESFAQARKATHKKRPSFGSA